MPWLNGLILVPVAVLAWQRGPEGLFLAAVVCSLLGCALLLAAKWHLLGQGRWKAFLLGLGPAGYPPGPAALWWLSLPWCVAAIAFWLGLLLALHRLG